jgi:hypothetical protein
MNLKNVMVLTTKIHNLNCRLLLGLLKMYELKHLPPNMKLGLIANKPDLIFSKKKTPWSESASELYRPSDRRLSAK